MPGTSDAQAGGNVEDRQKKYVLDPGIKRILITGVVLFLVLLIGTFFLRASRIPFFTQNFLALVVLIVVGIQAYIYSGQWHAMRDSLKAIREQINVGREQADWMRIQAQAMTSQIQLLNNQVDTMINQSRTMANQVGTMINQTEIMMLSLEETRKIVAQNERTIKATERSIEVAEKTSIYSQRAYVTAKIRDTGKNDERLQFRLRIENGGNTPANNVAIVYNCGLRVEPPCDMTEGQLICDESWSYIERFGVIAPNKSYHVLTTPETSFQPPNEYSRFVSDKLTYYCWGKIVYEDIFNETRSTWFCFFQSRTQIDGFPCKYGNEAI
jgi:hypothetical protein